MPFIESLGIFGAIAIVAISGLIAWEFVKIWLHDCWHSWAPWDGVHEGKQLRHCIKCNKAESRNV